MKLEHSCLADLFALIKFFPYFIDFSKDFTRVFFLLLARHCEKSGGFAKKFSRVFSSRPKIHFGRPITSQHRTASTVCSVIYCYVNFCLASSCSSSNFMLEQQLQSLKTENERLKSENRALARVVSKLSTAAAAAAPTSAASSSSGSAENASNTGSASKNKQN